jgi:hypothetical protein
MTVQRLARSRISAQFVSTDFKSRARDMGVAELVRFQNNPCRQGSAIVSVPVKRTVRKETDPQGWELDDAASPVSWFACGMGVAVGFQWHEHW